MLNELNRHLFGFLRVSQSEEAGNHLKANILGSESHEGANWKGDRELKQPTWNRSFPTPREYSKSK